MLGAMVTDYLARQDDFAVSATARSQDAFAKPASLYPNVKFFPLDAATATLDQISSAISGSQFAINCIGITKPLIKDDNAFEIERAIKVNAQFPHTLAHAAANSGTKIIQIATDCVYSGAKGRYTEKDNHDALDVYGKTKSLGETFLPATQNLRCSIIGPEPRDHKFLLDWFLGQKPGSEIFGFTNHVWNGVTTLQFARICAGIIRSVPQLPRLQHIVPAGDITKHDLLVAFAKAYNRPDLKITPKPAGTIVDRTLATMNQHENDALWHAAGYAKVPTVVDMVNETAVYKPLFA